MRWRRAAAREPRVGCATSAVWRDDRLGRTLVHLVNYVGPKGQSREGHRPAAQIWLEPWLGCSTYQSGLLTPDAEVSINAILNSSLTTGWPDPDAQLAYTSTRHLVLAAKFLTSPAP